MDKLQEEFQLRNAKKLDTIESIREALTEERIAVPGIVVCGAQSAGKSSVLEALSGVKLPRGETITTRVPLYLRLEASNTMGPSEVKVLIGVSPDLSQSGEDIQPDEIPDKITALTNQIAGIGGVVEDKPIHLKVIRRDSPNLTVIDLPGIAYNSAEEEMTDRIYELTKGLIDKYVSSEEMIILVVLPAADDFGAHESLKIAKQHDPSGKRTLGVITKTDRVDPGTNLLSKLRADGPGNIKLQMGYIAVRNRTPQEVKADISLQDARRLEKEFFETDPRVRGIEQYQYGMDEVIRRCVAIQSKKIDEFIPKMRRLLIEKISEVKDKIAQLPPSFDTEGECDT
jgi:dynamin 1-like protein